MSNQIEMNNFGVHPKALSLLHLLKERVLFDSRSILDWHGSADLRCSAWYNGRERGVCIYTRPDATLNRRVLIFGEHRNSDEIFLDIWEDQGLVLNPPTLAEYPDETYKHRKYFQHDALQAAADAIVDTINGWMNDGKHQTTKLAIGCLRCGMVYNNLASAEVALRSFGGCQVCGNFITLGLP